MTTTAASRDREGVTGVFMWLSLFLLAVVLHYQLISELLPPDRTELLSISVGVVFGVGTVALQRAANRRLSSVRLLSENRRLIGYALVISVALASSEYLTGSSGSLVLIGGIASVLAVRVASLLLSTVQTER